jgi:hypothetical protein
VVSHPEIDSPFYPLVGLPGQLLPFLTAPFLQLQAAAVLLGDQEFRINFWYKYHPHDHAHGTMGLTTQQEHQQQQCFSNQITEIQLSNYSC